MPPESERRKRDLDQWVSGVLETAVEGEPVSVDASFRRYYRYCRGARGHRGPESFVAMDAPPEREDCAAFIAVSELLQRAALNVPRVWERDLGRGFLLLSDLGDTTFLQALQDASPERARMLFEDAIAALVRLQTLTCPPQWPRYDAVLLQRELDLFEQWYVGRHLGRVWGQAGARAWRRLCESLIARALEQSQVLVHRDYMPRNLMLCPDHNPGVLDFQDAVLGPVSYDPVCLFEDAFLSWPRALVEWGLEHYRRRALAAGVPVPEDPERFALDCDLMAVQRHLKVIGIFARIRYRDGKPRYFEDTPRFFAYLRAAAARRPQALAPLAELLQELGEGEKQGRAP